MNVMKNIHRRWIIFFFIFSQKRDVKRPTQTTEHLQLFTLAPVFYNCCQLNLGVLRMGDNARINIPHFLSVNILLVSGMPSILPSHHTSVSGSFTTLRRHSPYFCILYLLLFSTLYLIKFVTYSSAQKVNKSLIFYKIFARGTSTISVQQK
jgi:hypothetical protein